jgi:hypothetical protein
VQADNFIKIDWLLDWMVPSKVVKLLALLPLLVVPPLQPHLVEAGKVEVDKVEVLDEVKAGKVEVGLGEALVMEEEEAVLDKALTQHKAAGSECYYEILSQSKP